MLDANLSGRFLVSNKKNSSAPFCNGRCTVFLFTCIMMTYLLVLYLLLYILVSDKLKEKIVKQWTQLF